MRANRVVPLKPGRARHVRPTKGRLVTRSIRRVLVPSLCVALIAGATLAQLAATAPPASAATPINAISLVSNTPTVSGQASSVDALITGSFRYTHGQRRHP